MLNDVLLQIQLDLAAYLALDPGLANVHVIPARTETSEAGSGGSVHDLIEDALAGIKTKNGKAGVAIIVLMPDVAPEDENLPGPQMDLECAVRIVENRLINEGGGGTGLSASRLALHLARLLHHWSPDGANVLRPARKLIQDVSTPERDAHEVTFALRLPVAALPRTATPVIAAAPVETGYQITLACATSGAAIYYTTTGALPTPAAGTPYATPFTLTQPTRLRVMATASGRIPSSIAEAETTSP